MVVWKGEIQESHGEKAYNLDRVDYEVPNFFVVTREEIRRTFDSRDPDDISETSIDLGEVMEAYKEVGISSEVRNASSRARNLVGGQRGKSRVSVRASHSGKSDFRLDVGSSDLKGAIKDVVSSYVREEGEFPALIVQKMIEADYTGAVIKGDRDYVEVVEGFGIPLEEGRTRPSRYLVGDEVKFKSPETQLKVTRNPMASGFRERKISPDRPFSSSEIKEFSRKVSESVKFAYKRGTFYVVDVFQTDFTPESLEGIRVSPGRINGEVAVSEEPVSPEEYRDSLISRKGGFTTTQAQEARKAGKPAVFSSDRDKKEFEALEKDKTVRTATQLLTVAELERTFEEKAYIQSYRDFFTLESGEAVVDARKLDPRGLEEALEAAEADFTLLIDEVDESLLYQAVKNGYSVAAREQIINQVAEVLEVLERRFILERLRE